ncbi:MAG: phosphoribosyltransferase family protein [Candidatus Nanoarchaeia archaeon]|nr:phosphoribosyltransferase family protein [Candidatus Nanoarchaeia archaeon]MDD5740769.1 phosphoribosyltransferase family protein [Candidatus Nanoarchaeia archaeon]
MSKKLIRLLKPLDIIYHKNKNMTLKHGLASDFYVDVKKAYGNPEALTLISEELWRRIDKNATCIATAGYGGMSPASVISSRYNIPLTLIRDEPKKHGKGGWIDGYIPNKQDKIAFVDDVFTTGGSFRKMIKTLEPTGAEMLGCYAVCKRGEGGLSVPLRYLFTPEDLIR